ncbi:hypothetical protein NMY22_g2097 [Coprinellus aureogranulatus]|nr:hypothetical protein NMY22_g2097 [Coprinellus aureogranulatus]
MAPERRGQSAGGRKKKANGAPAPRKELRKPLSASHDTDDTQVSYTNAVPTGLLALSACREVEEDVSHETKGDISNVRTQRRARVQTRSSSLANPDISHSGSPMVTRIVDEFCRACHDANALTLCVACGARVCSHCLEVNSGVPYLCTGCHDPQEPYPHRILPGVRSRGGPRAVDHGPVILISFFLEGSDVVGSPVTSAYHALHSYFGDNIAHMVVKFDLTEDMDTGPLTGVIQGLIKKLRSPTFRRCSRFIVSLTTHSDPERGDVHVVANNLGAIPVDQLLELLIPAELQEILQRGGEPCHNLFFFFVCGAVVNLDEPRALIRSFSKGKTFKEVVAFTKEHFQPFFAIQWFTDAIERVFIRGYESVDRTLLDEHRRLGQHTGFVIFSKKCVTVYEWSHPIHQPFGHRISSQCPDCNRDGTLEKRRIPGKTNASNGHALRCKHCKEAKIYELPSDSTWFNGQVPDERCHCAWVRKVILFSEPQSINSKLDPVES